MPDRAHDGDVARLQHAVALHRGRLVEACDDEWVLSARHRIETLYVTALDYLVQWHGSYGDVASVGRYGELALTIEPLRADIHRHLMAAYDTAGDIAYADAKFSVGADRPVMAIRGSGRAGDEIAATVRGEPSEPRAREVAGSRLVSYVDADDPLAVRDAVTAALGLAPSLARHLKISE